MSLIKSFDIFWAFWEMEMLIKNYVFKNQLKFRVSQIDSALMGLKVDANKTNE